jgi:hypothetical protein
MASPRTALPLLLLALCFSPLKAYGARPLGGRPLLTDDASAVDTGDMQIELGFSIEQPHGGGRQQGFPVIGLAYGLVDGLEVGLAIQRINSDARGEAPVEGFEDLHLVPKFQFLDEDEFLPAMAFTFDLKIPTASRRKGLSTGKLDEKSILIATKEFAPVSVDINLGYSHVGKPPGEKLKDQILGGVALRWAARERLELVGEIFGLSRRASGEKSEANFQLGARYEAVPSLTLDAGAGRSLLATGTRIQATLGLTWSFPVKIPVSQNP